jgi:hypothetical protein
MYAHYVVSIQRAPHVGVWRQVLSPGVGLAPCTCESASVQACMCGGLSQRCVHKRACLIKAVRVADAMEAQ